jgi:hypothetical protein
MVIHEKYEEVSLYIQFVVAMGGNISFCSVVKEARSDYGRLFAVASSIRLSSLFIQYFRFFE